jgi:hypothetical protein
VYYIKAPAPADAKLLQAITKAHPRRQRLFPEMSNSVLMNPERDADAAAFYFDFVTVKIAFMKGRIKEI